MTNRRQRQQYIFAGLLAVIAIANVIFFLTLHRPARNEYLNLQESIGTLGSQINTSRAGVANLERTSAELERFDQDRQELLTNRFLPRQTGYSQVLGQLDEIVRRTGVTKTRVNYPIEKVPRFGLYALGITLPVEGTYSDVVDFIRELEESDTFFLISAIDLQSFTDVAPAGATPGPLQPVPAASAPGSVALQLALETYFYQ